MTGLYVSTNSFETRDLPTMLDTCDRHRLEGLELSAVEQWDPALVGATTYPCRFLVHNYFPPADPPFVVNVASQDANSLAQSRAHCRAAIDLSVQLGGAVYAAHAGYTAELAPHALGRPERLAALPPGRFADYDDAYATLVESARELSVYGQKRGVRFLVENHGLSARAGPAGRRLLPMVEADELARLAQDVDHSWFGLLIDVGHLKVSATTLGFDPHVFLDRLAPFTAALHLSDNDGDDDEHRSFDDHAWFLPRLRDFPDACVTVELDRVAVEEILAVSDTVARWR
jgi:sugar phosphate isomerase/epimerase